MFCSDYFGKVVGVASFETNLGLLVSVSVLTANILWCYTLRMNNANHSIILSEKAGRSVTRARRSICCFGEGREAGLVSLN